MFVNFKISEIFSTRLSLNLYFQKTLIVFYFFENKNPTIHKPDRVPPSWLHDSSNSDNANS